MQRNIVALGGTPARPETIPPIVDYLLGLTGKPRPRVCVIPTAKGDQPEVILSFYNRIPAPRAGCGVVTQCIVAAPGAFPASSAFRSAINH